MELKRLTVRIRCDNGVCRNNAEYAVKRSGTPVARELHLCSECLAALAALYEGISAEKKEDGAKKKGGKNVGTNMGNRD